MKNLNKLLLKAFSIILSVMLLNVSAFATGRYATIDNWGDIYFCNGEENAYLTLSNYHENNGDGGVFLVTNSNTSVRVFFTDIHNNSASGNGGVLARTRYTSGYDLINDSILSYNSATNGGAVYLSTGSVRIQAAKKTTELSNNSSSQKGGAIYNAGNLGVGVAEPSGSQRVYFKYNNAGTFGGAIYNCQNSTTTIGDYLYFSTNTATYYGGAIYNEQKGKVNIGKQVTFNDNSSQSYGGAIYNEGNMYIDRIAFFERNKTVYNGGAVYNSGSIIIGDGATFDNNKNTNTAANTDGGAIYNSGYLTIGNQSKFKENSSVRSGGAIYSYGDTELNIGEYVRFSSNTAVNGSGGAIYNYSLLESTTTIGRFSEFLNNKAMNGDGGAIYNYGCKLEIGYATMFDGNTAARNGGAIFHGDAYVVATMDIKDSMIFQNNKAGNNGGAVSFITNDMVTIGSSARFIKNSATNYGGAIESHGDANIGNSVQFSSNTAKYGGAIANSGGGLLTLGYGAYFYGNEAEQDGGAIYNNQFSNILNMTDIGKGKINVGNTAYFKYNCAPGKGGAVYNAGSFTLGDNVTFKDNSSNGGGGAVYNTGTFISGNYLSFDENDSSSNGGALYNSGTAVIGTNSTFCNGLSKVGGAVYNSNSFTVGKYAQFLDNWADNGDGGAIFSEKGNVGIGSETKFNYNHSEGSAGAIYNGSSSRVTIENNISFTSNTAKILGGAILNVGNMTIDNNVKFTGNKSLNQSGGAIYNNSSSTISIENGVAFTSNTAKITGGAIANSGNITIGNDASFTGNQSLESYGGAIHNTGSINFGNNAKFKGNFAKENGGAIYNIDSLVFADGVEFNKNFATDGGAILNYVEGTITIQNGAKFIDNKSENLGGAIYNRGTLNLISNTKNIEFTGNKQNAETENEVTNALYNSGVTNLWASNEADIIFNDSISGFGIININKQIENYQENIGTGKIVLNADMSDCKGTVNFYNGTIELKTNGKWFGGDMTVENSPVINMANNIVDEHNFNNLTINGNLQLSVDADLANGEMDTISATSFGNSSGKITVNKINILSDIDEKRIKKIEFADDVLKDKVESVNKASSLLYNYTVKYDKQTGYFTFINGLNGKTKNMGTVASAVSASAGGYATQSVVANQVFASMDGKVAKVNKASTDPSNLYVSAGDQVFDNSGTIERGLWLKPFVAQETVKIGEADVDNSLYGTLAGIDFPVGQDKQVSFYLGYAGSKQEVDDIKSNQTGYVLGATGMIIKDKWYAGLTANVMFNKASIDTDFGTDDVDMNMFSFGAKAGYNYDMGKNWILEPNLTLMYGIVNSGSYETSQGAEIDSQSVSNILAEPQVKAKLQMNNGWQPYGLLGYAANLSSKPTVKVEGIELELDSIDGYIEYGAGVNKDFIGTVWSCYAQVTGRSGGRNGFAGNLGIKYKF